MTAAYTWKTYSVVQETHDTVTITFETGPLSFHYKAGQYIQISLVIGNERITRSYSLSSTPGDARPAITVKKVAGGKMSTYIVNHAAAINEWQVDGPHGFFYPDERAVKSPCFVFIGGGSGITPLFAQINYLLRHTTGKVLLINANHRQEDIIFGKPLEYIEHSFSHRFTAWHALSGLQKGEKVPYRHVLQGRLSKLVLKKILRDALGNETAAAEFFMCGPSGLMQLAEDTIAALPVPKEQVHREYFAPAEKTAMAFVLPSVQQEVLLHYYDQTNLLEVKPGTSILEAALADRIPVPYSCRQGTCGICAGKLISGRVHMSDNYALPASKVEEGYILLCQSHPLDNNVTVEV